MRKSTIAISVACMLLALGMVTTQLNAKEGDVKADKAQTYRVSYKVDDLAVWTENGTKFDTSLLEEFLKLKVANGQWASHTRIEPYPAEKKLVISSTEEVQTAVSACLRSMRERKR